MARPRLPEELKKLKGTYRYERDNPDKPHFEMVTVNDIAINPGMNEKAVKTVKNIANELIKAQVLQKTDLFLFETLINEIDTYWRITEEINGLDSFYYVNPSSGNTTINPLLKFRQQSMDSIMRICGKFGLTPSDRQRLIINVAKGEESKNKIDEILSKKNG